MKTKTVVLSAVALAFAGGFFLGGVFRPGTSGGQGQGDGNGALAQATFFYCSMHPQINQQGAGKCPICGMALVPMEKERAGEGADFRGITMSLRARKLAEVESVPAARKFVSAEVRMAGKIEYDETKISWITARIGGRLDRLYVDYTGISVKKGDHLAELYSPELLQAQEELLSAVKIVPGLKESGSAWLREQTEANVEAAREKLRLWGVSDRQIQEIESRGQPSRYITIHSPISGAVVHKNAMEGMYVQTGTQIYQIADLSKVWVKLDAYESDLPWLHYGQEVEFRTEAYPGEIFTGRIAFIDPVLNSRTRTVKIRVNLPNPDGRLKPDMFVRAVVKSKVAGGGRVMDASLAGKWISPMHPEIIKDEPGSCDVCGMDLVSAESLGYVENDAGKAPLVIPASAPLITGKRAVVYIDQGEGRYQGREIELGPRAGNSYLVESGLNAGERVVTKGNFKIDSAVQIRAQPSMMNPDGFDSGHRRESEILSEPLLPKEQSATPQRAVPVPEDFREHLDAFVSVYLEAQRDLSRDKFSQSQRQSSAFQERLERTQTDWMEEEDQEEWRRLSAQLKQGAERFSGAEGLDAARSGFRQISESLIAILRRWGSEGQRPLLVYYCPMAFEGKGGRWLQSAEGVENPYYGSRMFACGRLEERLTASENTAGSSGAHE